MSDEGASWIGAARYAKKDEVRQRAMTQRSISTCCHPSCCSEWLCLDQDGEWSTLCRDHDVRTRTRALTRKLCFWVRKVILPSGNSIHTTCFFFVHEEFLGVGSFARLPSASHKEGLPRSSRLAREVLPRRSSEKLFQGVSASHEKPF
jgi:hypothetical protein